VALSGALECARLLSVGSLLGWATGRTAEPIVVADASTTTKCGPVFDSSCVPVAFSISSRSVKEQIKIYIDQLERKLAAARAFMETLDEKPIETAKNEALPSVTPALHVLSQSPTPKREDTYGNQTGLLRMVIRPGMDFDVSLVDQWLADAGKKMDRAMISQVLSRMRRSGELLVISKGSGKRASTYRLREKSQTSRNDSDATKNDL
jgi:hypothetical protein